MSFMGDIVSRWVSNSPIPAWSGAAPEGTNPPYAVFSQSGGSEERTSSNVVAWQSDVVTLSISASTSTDAEIAKDFARDLFNMKSFGDVADMVVTNRNTFYSDTPTLTGNRGWVTQIDFQVKH